MIKERKSWTTRGVMTQADKDIVTFLSTEDKAAARIFITGESHRGYIGEEVADKMLGLNDAYIELKKEPLFVETRYNTIKMLRFEPEVAWKLMKPDTILELVDAENDRLGVTLDIRHMKTFDYYEAMFEEIREAYGGQIPIYQKNWDIDAFYNAVYFTCLLLFNKQGYMDVPVSQHFADSLAVQYIKRMKYRDLTAGEGEELKELIMEYGSIEALTNQEVLFVIECSVA